MKRSGQHGAYLDETLGLGVAMRRELLFARRDDALFFMNNIGYIFIVRRLEKQSNPILSRLDSISNLELNLRYMAHVAQMLTQEPIYKSSSSSALSPSCLLIYGDNTCPPGFGNDSSKINPSLHLPVNAH